jgi:hypothetical protein
MSHVPRRIFKKEKSSLTWKPKKIKMSKSFVDIDDAAAKETRAFGSGKTF